MPWTCPECGRRFTRSKQSHSCVSVTEAALFEGKPEPVAAAFHKLRDAVAAFANDVHVDAVKASINFGARSHFAAAWPRASRLDVELVLDAPLKSPRVSKLQSYGPTKHVHWIQVAGPKEIDRELLGWLRRSYELRR